MNLSQKGLDLIKGFEGLRLEAYKAVSTEKYWTIGYGHYGSDVKQGEKITQERAEELLKQDVKKFVDGVNNLVKVPITQNNFDALVSFAYNVGLGALGRSDLLDYINRGQANIASYEFDRWNKSGGKVLNGLIRRRKAERTLFDTPVETVVQKPANTSTSIPVKGRIKMDKIKNYTPIYSEISDKSSRLGTAKKNDEFDIAGSVPDWYEIIYDNKRAYVKAKYASRI